MKARDHNKNLERKGRAGPRDGHRAASLTLVGGSESRPSSAGRAPRVPASPRTETVLGIDPGTATMGWGVVRVTGAGNRVSYVQHGAIVTPPGWPMPRRLNRLFEGVTELLEGYEPSAVAVEELFFGRNVSTAITVGQARGTVLLAAHRAGAPVHEYKPAQVKQAVTSYGAADKRQVQEMVKTLLKLREIPRPDDAADGLAIALTHAHTRGR